MSYLSALRLHFAGQFQANVSTVNNDPAHFDNAIFKPGYQSMQGPGMNPPNGWFNPEGDAAFRLLGCAVTSAWTPAGRVMPPDPILTYSIADSDGAVPAKLVDLDPQQQLASEIWGLEVRIADGNGDTVMRGSYEHAAFIDIWDRAMGGAGGDIGAGATYQSVLEGIVWGDVSGSPFLAALQTSCGASGRLSIKFNVDGLNMDFTSPQFMCGRIVGTIGNAQIGEPKHLVIGRQFMAVGVTNDPSVNFFKPVGGINFCPALMDEATSTLFVDLGNALTTGTPGGSINDIGDLAIGVYDLPPPKTGAAGTAVPLGTVPATGTYGYAQDPTWYPRTAGVVTFPLDSAQLSAAAASPLVITGNDGIEIAESPHGAFIRADTFVYRVSPGDAIDIPVYATQWGRPLVDAGITFSLDPSQLQVNPAVFPYIAASPNVAIPTDALTFAPTATTQADGRAHLLVTANDPGTPRWFGEGTDYGIDGQVYGIRPAFTDPTLRSEPVNQWNFISFLLWSGFVPSDPVTWADIQPVFQQYANLYPVMLRFLNLAHEKAVRANLRLLKLAFGLPMSDPNAMPVTRDLSPAKRAAILAWLDKPEEGTAPVTAAAPQTPAQTTPAPPTGARRDLAKGGKAAAAARRLVVQALQGVRS